jgi:O-antigen/teichoic acid export membrane protein
VQALTTEKAKIVVVHRGLCRLLGLLLPMLLATAAAPELISVTLGPKWEELSFLLRLFFPLYVFNAICGQAEPVLLAYGPFDIAFWCIVG